MLTERRLQKECFKERDEMDTLFNAFKHISEIYINGRETVDKLVMTYMLTGCRKKTHKHVTMLQVWRREGKCKWTEKEAPIVGGQEV